MGTKIIINGQSVEIPSGGSAGGVPVGTIVIWSGTADNIPTGWQLCDGTNGTPDLRDKFVLGAGTAHSAGETGGEEEVTLTVNQMPSHGHSLSNSYGAGNINGNAYNFANKYQRVQADRTSIASAGGNQPHNNMPPYYTLCYIMKLTADPNDGVTVEEMNAAINAAITGAMEEAY